MTTPPPVSPATNTPTSSRLIFKNLPPKLSKPLAANMKLTSPPPGTILSTIAAKFPSVAFTDIFFPKKGASKTCFIGIKDQAMGKSIKEWFDGSYVESCKVKVEYARAKEVDTSPQANTSKQQPASKASKKDRKEKKDKKEKKTEEAVPATKKELDKERMKQEYIGAMLGNKGKVWSNDDGLNNNNNNNNNNDNDDQQQQQPNNTKDDDDDSDSDVSRVDDSESDDEDDLDPLKNAKIAGAASDMDFLKSKKVSSKELDDDFTEEKLQHASEEKIDDGAESSSVASSDSDSDSDNDDDDEDDDNNPTNRLFVRNLPYNCTETSLKTHFMPFSVEVAHIPIDGMGRSKGFGFLTFKSTKEAADALGNSSTVFEGRNIGVSFAKPDKNSGRPDEEEATYKEKKEKERKANAGTSSDQKSWSSSYVNSDSVAEAVAQKLGVTKGELFDVEASGVAAKLAVAEVEIVKEIESFFEERGYKNEPSKPKSTTDILLKNIAHNVTTQDILKTFTAYGTVSDVVLPRCGCAAIVSFKESTEARKAFRRVAYGKFWGRPIYLEWASEREGESSTTENSTTNTQAVDSVEVEEEKDEDVISHSLFVKNLNFTTGEDSLSAFFEKIAPSKVVAVKIPTKATPEGSTREGQTMSMGYGFVEFKDKQSCTKALKEGNGSMLDGHVVEVKRSDKSLAGDKNQKSSKPASKTAKKIMVRNVPFEASKVDILQLFGNFGKIKKATIPKKFDGTSRGFAFVEYCAAKDAREAMDRLKATHLYGRHLVLEWSEDRDGIDDLRGKAKRDVDAMKGLEEGKALKKFKGKHTTFD
ncbi:hypothetical protein TrVE_jg6815 [Triparma verrucosa]|uniref:RRM domain-containing protein n=1 Tax=Triparma verrucosa TaxID=1606542 RepID=A0A9W7BBK9_9STRA|nr:hypothetical protein TrVE_jg6815 [Triparma verrucosa]